MTAKAKENTKTKTKGERLYPWAWSTRSFSLGVNALLLMQITYYATQVVGLSAQLVGVLLLASKLFDGITDLAAGYIIDRTDTKLGKARPYELFLIPTWILTIVLFSTPLGMTEFGKATWIFILYTLINSVCITFLSSNQTVFLARSTTDDSLRAKAITTAGILTMIVPTIVAILLPQLMATWGTEPGGWTKIIAVFGVPLTIIGLGRFFFIKEIKVEEDSNEKEKQLTFKESLTSIVQNKYLLIFVCATFFSAIINNLNAGVGSYFFQYIMGDITKMSMVSMLGLLTPFALLVFPLVVRNGNAMNFVRVGLVLAIIGNVIKYFAGTNLTLIMVGSLIATIPGPATIMMIGGLFIIQCMDYGEWKTGKRPESMLTSVNTFASKVGSGIASGLLGLIMSLAGFVSGGGDQPASAINAIQFGYTILPALLCGIMLIILHFYDLEKKQGDIRAELAKRNENKTGDN